MLRPDHRQEPLDQRTHHQAPRISCSATTVKSRGPNSSKKEDGPRTGFRLSVTTSAQALKAADTLYIQMSPKVKAAIHNMSNMFHMLVSVNFGTRRDLHTEMHWRCPKTNSPTPQMRVHPQVHTQLFAMTGANTHSMCNWNVSEIMSYNKIIEISKMVKVYQFGFPKL